MKNVKRGVLYSFIATFLWLGTFVIANIVHYTLLILSGVYNNPLECRHAPQFIIGKTIDSETTLAVTELAISNAKPLIQNIYKVQMAKVILSDTLLSII